MAKESEGFLNAAKALKRFRGLNGDNSEKEIVTAMSARHVGKSLKVLADWTEHSSTLAASILVLEEDRPADAQKALAGLREFSNFLKELTNEIEMVSEVSKSGVQ